MPNLKSVEAFGGNILDLQVLNHCRWRTLPHPVDQLVDGASLAFEVRFDGAVASVADPAGN